MNADPVDVQEPRRDLSARAQELLEQRLFNAEALELNLQIIGSSPQDVAAHNRLGQWYAAHGDWQEAGKVFSQALRLDPSSSVARTQLKETLRWVTVSQEVARIAEQDGRDALRSLVNAAKDVGTDPRVRLEGRRYLLAEDDSAGNWAGLGRELGREGEYDQALAAYRRALEIDPSDDMRRIVYVGAAAVFRRMGREEKAAELLVEVLKSDPGNEYARTLGAYLPTGRAASPALTELHRLLHPDSFLVEWD